MAFKLVKYVELFILLYRIVSNQHNFEFLFNIQYYSGRSESLCNALYTPAAIIPPKIGATQ